MTINQKFSNLWQSSWKWLFHQNSTVWIYLPLLITAQPDFADVYISYIPDKLCVESNPLKLYLFGSYRAMGIFTACINTIGKDLVNLLNPRYLEVWGKFTPRGGISIDPYYNYSRRRASMKVWQEQRLFQHDLYPEKLTTAKQIRKSPVPQAEGARLFQFQPFFCSKEIFRNRITYRPAGGQGSRKSILVEEAAPPRQQVPSYELGLLKVQWCSSLQDQGC